MITGDISAEIARLLTVGVVNGELPEQAAPVKAAGTWRAVPAASGGGPGTYATSVPLALANQTGRPARDVAAYLGARLAEVDWIRSARVTGPGYLTVAVTACHLAGLAGRIVAAGTAAPSSDELAGTKVAAPELSDPADEPSWAKAWSRHRDALSGRLALAAGAEVLFFRIEQELAPESTTRAGSVNGQLGPVARAVAHYGRDAVRYALACTPVPRADLIARRLEPPLDLTNSFIAVQYAHADAASTLRWAATLGLTQAADTAADSSPSDELAWPELVLLDIMSWLSDRVAAAARRRRPAEVCRYLEQLAAAWLDCRERCPALPFYGAAAPVLGAGTQTTARLGLAAAAKVAIASAFDLLGVSPPDRM